MAKQQFEQEKEDMINQFQEKIQELQNESRKIMQYPEGEEWKERVLKLEVQRQRELDDFRYQLNNLKRVQISPLEIEFNAERQAYESTILQLRNQIAELQQQFDYRMQSEHMQPGVQQEIWNQRDTINHLHF